MNELEVELKRLIVSALALEDVEAASIDTDAPLFGEGLGLDSIDALELSVVLSREYGVSIKADDAQNRQIFSSVRALAAFVAANRSSAARGAAALGAAETTNPAT
jgi:acyl carrier protein